MSRPRLTRCASGALASATTAPVTRHQWRKDAYEVTGTVCQRDSALSPLRSEHDATSRASALAPSAPRSSPRCRHSRWSTAPSTSTGFPGHLDGPRLFSTQPRGHRRRPPIRVPASRTARRGALHQKRFYGLDVDARSGILSSPWERPGRSSRRSSRWCSFRRRGGHLRALLRLVCRVDRARGRRPARCRCASRNGPSTEGSLRTAFSDRTRMVFITPHNPAVFSGEIDLICRFAA